ncbi:MAG: glutamate--tRNA ligase [Sulfurimonas sp.]|nr:glutamate--tRNA ligase [Sulfurimonas sp.]
MLRFSSSPIGDMHIGNLRVALLSYIISQQKKEDLIVRIEDMDKERNIVGKDQEILDILDLFEIKYSQTIYQSQNARFYSAMALQLMHDKKAFSCFCSPQWLEGKQEEAKAANKPYRYDDACATLPAELVIDNTNPFTVRIKKTENSITIKDHIKGEMTCTPQELDSFVILKHDKTPTYDFASAIDDMLSDISLVIRGEGHMSSTPKEDMIRTALGYEKKIEYAHLPIILNDSDDKMSEKGDASSVIWLLKEGFLPSAISNYLISMGNKTPKEIFTLEESLEWFGLENLSKSPFCFKMDTLRHINKEHLKNMQAKELSRYVGFADEEIGKVAKVYLSEASTTKELKSKIEPIFAPKVIPADAKEQTQSMAECIKNAPYFDTYEDFKNHIIKETRLSEKDFIKSLRLLLTGAEFGPDISELYQHLKNYLGEIVK